LLCPFCCLRHHSGKHGIGKETIPRFFTERIAEKQLPAEDYRRIVNRRGGVKSKVTFYIFLKDNREITGMIWCIPNAGLDKNVAYTALLPRC